MARYADAVAWIAHNDEPTFTQYSDKEEVASMMTTLLVADVWAKDPEDVAHDVIVYRRRYSRQYDRP